MVWFGLDKNDLVKLRMGKNAPFFFGHRGTYAIMVAVINRYLRLGKIEIML